MENVSPTLFHSYAYGFIYARELLSKPREQSRCTIADGGQSVKPATTLGHHHCAAEWHHDVQAWPISMTFCNALLNSSSSSCSQTFCGTFGPVNRPPAALNIAETSSVPFQGSSEEQNTKPYPQPCQNEGAQPQHQKLSVPLDGPAWGDRGQVKD